MQQIRNEGVVTPAMAQRATVMLAETAELRPLVLDLAVGTLQAQRLGKGLEGWLFTSRMAEQATHPDIARYHAEVFTGSTHVLEICTGAGIDTQALAAVVGQVTTYEADPATAAVARMNFDASGLTNITVVEEAWTSESQPPQDVDGIWADPSRRPDANRRSRIAADYLPSLDSILRLHHLPTGVKVGPGDSIPPWAEERCTSEYIGFGRECRERILWSGIERPKRCATLLPGHHHLSVSDPAVSDLAVADPAVAERYLIEPHNAAIAAGLVPAVFALAGVRPIDPLIAYGIGGEQPPPSPWYEIFEVVRVDTGISERRIRERVGELGFNSRTEIKKRGWDGDPEVLRTKIDFPKTEHPGVILLTRRGDAHLTIYARRRGSR
ncbi:MAG: class I SAM-dependent methyltransferase [Ignavibacteriae bacterium]|nr:MAG: class I SAM-dependent methyltransferase [Ignavibacteriota bacterium]